MGGTKRRRITGPIIRGRARLLAGCRVTTALSLMLSALVWYGSFAGGGHPVLARSAQQSPAHGAPTLPVREVSLAARVTDSDRAGFGTLALDPDAGPPGTTVMVEGNGFVPASIVILTYVDAAAPAAVVLTTTVSADGSLPQATFIVPQNATLGALGQVVAGTGSAAEASALFGVTPFTQGFDVSSNVAAPGGITQISGSGFAPNSPVAISLSDAAGVQTVLTQPVSTTSAGVIPPMSVSIPVSATAGLAAINAVDATGSAGGVPLTVAPNGSSNAIQLSPAVAALGEPVRLAAAGFSPNEPVQLYLVDASTAVTDLTSALDLQADATGVLSGSFALPLDDQSFANPPSGRVQGSGSNAGSLLEVVVKGASSGTTLQAPLMVPGTAVTIVPARVASHHVTMLSGRGYYGRETVTVSAVGDNGAITQLGLATASAAGAFNLAVTAPAPSPGGTGVLTFTVSATGEASDLVASSQLTTVAPAALTFSQYVVASGQATMVQGTGFDASAVVTITVQAPWGSKIGSRSSPVYPLQAVTDLTGAFSLDVAVPSDAAAGSAVFRAADVAGRSATSVLTVANFPASLHISDIIAGAGTSITVDGTGFASDERVDLFLAPPSIPVRPLAISTHQVTTDAHGSFVTAFLLPTGGGVNSTVSSGGYMLWARGELSARQAAHGLAIQVSPTGTPGPAVRTTSTPLPSTCTGTTSGGGTGSSSYTVAYFANGTTLVVHAAPGSSVTYSQDLYVANVGDQAATVTVMYLVASGPSAPAIRQVSFTVPAHGVVQHSVNHDVGTGHTLSIMVRIETPTACAAPAPAPPSCSTAGNICDTGIRVTLLTWRTLREPLSECSQSKRDDPAAVVCTLSKGSASVVTRTLDASATAGSSQGAMSHAQGGGGGGPSTIWRFAEGNTGTPFQDVIDVLNPETVPAIVRITFFTPTGPVPVRDPITVHAFDTVALDVRAIYLKAIGCEVSGASTAKLASKCAGPLAGIALGEGLQSTEPIVAERTLSWGSGQPGAKPGYDVSPGTPAASTVAHFAYASTLGGDQAYLALINPAGSCAESSRCTAQVSVTVYAGSGLRISSGSISIPPGSRATLSLSAIAPGKIFAFSTRSTVPVVAELTQYVGGPATKGEHPGFEAHGSGGSTELTAIGLPSLGVPILVRVFNPTGGRMFVRLSVFQGAGAVVAPAGYWVGGRASLEAAVPSTTARGGDSPGGTSQPLAVEVTCGGVCVPAVLEGVRGATVPFPAHPIAQAMISSVS